MELSDQELDHLAKLAALSLNDEEREALKDELAAILEYVQTLSLAPTRGVEPTSQVYGLKNVTRDDINLESFSIDQVKSLAADFAHGGFRVPKVL